MTYDPVAISDTPVDVVDELSLVVGSRYGLQYQGVGSIRVHEGDSSTAPARTDAATAVPRMALNWTITPASGEGIWCWVDVGTGGELIVWDA